MEHSVRQGGKVFVYELPLVVNGSIAFRQYECFKEERDDDGVSLMMVLPFDVRKLTFSPNLGDGVNDAIGR